MTLSGGMKRRVMIAKALAHEPEILFLDEPTAGVDVELRRDMWELVRALRDRGVTIILTTHYIEEAEEMADRVGVITKGELILVEEKDDADAQARQEAARPAPARAARLPFPDSAEGIGISAQRTTAATSSTPSTPRPSAPASPRSCSALARAGIRFQGSQTPKQSRSKTSSSAW